MCGASWKIIGLSLSLYIYIYLLLLSPFRSVNVYLHSQTNMDHRKPSLNLIAARKRRKTAKIAKEAQITRAFQEVTDCTGFTSDLTSLVRSYATGDTATVKVVIVGMAIERTYTTTPDRLLGPILTADGDYCAWCSLPPFRYTLDPIRYNTIATPPYAPAPADRTIQYALRTTHSAGEDTMQVVDATILRVKRLCRH